MPIVARLFLAVGVLLALLVGVAGDAAAHAALVRTDPPAGAALPEAPTAIRLWFTEPLEPRYTRAQVLDATGSTVPGVSSAIAPDDDHQLVVTLPADLPDGGYTVAWRNLSSADGHTLEGYFGIHVGAGATPGRTPGLAVAPANDTARALSRGLALIGLTAVLAIAPVTLGVLDPTARAIPGLAGRVRPRLRRYALLAASVALLGSVAALAAQAAAIAPDVALPTAIAETLAATRYGQLWLFRVLGLLLVTAAVAAALRGPPSWRRGALAAGTVVGLGVPVPFSLLSHAAAQPHGAATAVAVDALHLLAAAIWGGGLLLLAAVLAPALRPFAAGSWREALRVAIPRFSALGLAAWSVLWLSGLYGAWLQVGSLEALTQTPYGQSLLIKGALLIPVSALAAWHLGLGWRGVPGVQLRHAATTFALEALLVVAVLLVVGRLIGQEPAREVLASRTPPQIRVPLTFATDEGERPGQLVIAPGAAGANTFTLELGGLPVPAAAEGVLRFALPTQDIGQQELRLPQAAPNRFVAQGSELALGGDWQVAGIVGAIVGAIGVAALAAAAVLRGVPRARRGGVAGVGLVAVAAGCVILGSARIPVAAPGAALAQAVPVPGSPPVVWRAAAEHDHALATPAMPVSESFAGIGTPVGENGLVVTLGADARQPGPTDLTITARDRSETPVSEARVVVFARMAGMGGNSQGTAAVEEEPGRYRAEDVPLSMAGTWQLTVRISPRGQPTSVVEFAIEVP
jgi:copper transport protein